jgi:hypothetical protein
VVEVSAVFVPGSEFDGFDGVLVVLVLFIYLFLEAVFLRGWRMCMWFM